MAEASDHERRLHLQNERRWPEIAPHSCFRCQAILLDISQHAVGAKDELDHDGCLRRRDIKNKATGLILADIIGGALAGCAFFRVMIEADAGLFHILSQTKEPIPESELDAPFQASGVELVAAEDYTGYRIGELPNLDTVYHGSDLIVWTINNLTTPDYENDAVPSVCFYRVHAAAPRYREGQYLGMFELYEMPSPTQSHLVNSTVLPPNLAPASELSLSRATRWLNTCKTSHASCNAYVMTYAPKRLLEIGEGGKTVKLLTGADISSYATLSYCWGGDQPAKTIKALLDQYHRPFSTSDLPATIQDAVRMCVGLGFCHIWIDALCITQDDESDVAEQISDMYKIYKGSSITIVASRAKRSVEGFLQPRSGWHPCSLRAKNDYADSSPVLLSPYNHTHDDNPLFVRGWTFQETHLSARLLTFGKRNIGWCCLEGEQADGGYDAATGSGFINPGSKDINKEAHPRAWASLVKTYANLLLSVWTDKLPAIGALAQEYSVKHPVTQYVAGIWREDLLWQLLWTNGHWNPDILRAEPKRAEVFSGPTWSWCSMMAAGITFPTQPPSKFEMTCAVSDVQVDFLDPSNPFGRVSRAQITLRGRLRGLLWVNRTITIPRPTYDEDDVVYGGARAANVPAEYFLETSGIDLAIRRPGFDEQYEWPPDSETTLWALEIGRTETKYKNEGSHAILLRIHSQSQVGNLYQRVGTFHPPDIDWFEQPGAEDTEVVIV